MFGEELGGVMLPSSLCFGYVVENAREVRDSNSLAGIQHLPLEELLPTCSLDLVSQFGQFRHHFITMVSLDFDIPILNGTA